MTINDIYVVLVEYVKENKQKYDIDYLKTIESLKELIKELECDFEGGN